MTIIHKRDPDAVVAMLTADHHIAQKEKFRDVLEKSLEVAKKDYIVTLGIEPSYPATGFGYIRQGDELFKAGDYTCYKAAEFTEKPNEVTATSFVASEQYSWNSGMFIWKTSVAMKEFERQQLTMYQHLSTIQETIDTPKYQETLEVTWGKLTKISIDFAIMEGAEQMAVIPVDIGWLDIGSWSSLFEVLPLDKYGNSFKGKFPEKIVLDTKNTLVFSDRLVATIGVNDLVVVDTEDALLICHKDHSQSVRDVVSHLRARKLDQYL